MVGHLAMIPSILNIIRVTTSFSFIQIWDRHRLVRHVFCLCLGQIYQSSMGVINQRTLQGGHHLAALVTFNKKHQQVVLHHIFSGGIYIELLSFLVVPGYFQLFQFELLSFLGVRGSRILPAALR